MGKRATTRATWAVAWAVATASSSGCATTVTMIGQRDAPVLAAERDADGTTRVEVTDGNSHPVANVAVQLGLLADALVAGNVVASTLAFQSNGVAYGTIGAASLALGWLDSVTARAVTRAPGELMVERTESNTLRLETAGVAFTPAGPGRWVALLQDPKHQLGAVRLMGADRSVVAEAQVLAARTPPHEQAATAQRVPPRLVASVRFESDSGDGRLRAGGTGEAIVTLVNEGQGPARGVRVRLAPEQPVPDLRVMTELDAGDLAPGASVTVRGLLRAGKQLPTQPIALRLNANDADGFDAPPLRLAFEGHAYEPVRLAVAQVAAENAAGETTVRRGEQLEIKALVRNSGKVAARDVQAELVLGDRLLLAASPLVQPLGTLPPGSSRVAQFSIVVANGYQGPATLPLRVRLQEPLGEGNVEAPAALALDEAAPRLREVVVATRPVQAPTAVNDDELELVSEVDQPVPNVQPEAPDAVALVIGIEHYQHQVPSVPFARRDAQTVSRYFQQALGVPPQNMVVLLDAGATKNNMALARRKLEARVTPGRSRVYIGCRLSRNPAA